MPKLWKATKPTGTYPDQMVDDVNLRHHATSDYMKLRNDTMSRFASAEHSKLVVY